MNILLDTNIVIDYFIRDEYRNKIETLLMKGKSKSFRFYISYLSVANFAYILRKMPQSELYALIRKIMNIFDVVPNNSHQIDCAMAHCAKDFEDALQHEAAIDSRCDCIITRNLKDYYFSEIPVYSTDEFTEKYL